MVEVEKYLYMVCEVRGDEEGGVATDHGCMVNFLNARYPETQIC